MVSNGKTVPIQLNQCQCEKLSGKHYPCKAGWVHICDKLSDGVSLPHQQRGTIEADGARWGPVLRRQGGRSTTLCHRVWGTSVTHRCLLGAYGEPPQEGACRTTRHTRLWHHARTGSTRCPPVPPPAHAPPRHGTRALTAPLWSTVVRLSLQQGEALLSDHTRATRA